MIDGKLMNQTVTLYHKTGETNGRAEYVRYLLTYVRFERKEGVLPVKNGLRPYNSFRLFSRIPGRVEDNEGNYLMFCMSNEYDKMEENQRSSCWTVAEEDFLIDGAANYDMANKTLDEVKAETEVFNVNVVTYGKLREQRFVEITGRGRYLD